MKKKKLAWLFSLGLGLALSCSIALADPIVSIQPSAAAIPNGWTFSLSVDISGVTDLYAYQFDIGFDPSLLEAREVNNGDFLALGGFDFFIPGYIDNGLGSITFTANTLLGPGPGVSGSGTLATLTFQALGALGVSPVSLSNVILLDSSYADISFTTQDGSVEVVPEPATLALTALGLAGLVAIGLRRKP